MGNGFFSYLKIRKEKKLFKKRKKKRFSLKIEGSPFVRGLVLSKLNIEARQPNSAMRKCVKVQLIKNSKQVIAFCPKDGAIKFIEQHDEVLLAGCGGRLGKQKGDTPGVAFKVIKVNNLSLESLTKGKITKQ